jgi:outer membrane protein OmpA-like peptidoglycan-associated protein
MGIRTPHLVLVATVVSSLGCAAELVPPPVLSDAQLGRIIIYRNGVAYFERYTTLDEEALTIKVPAERVDDFLKSLTIVDEQTGDTMPVSFPTVESGGGEVKMTIELPKGPHRLRVSYVTESPAWKPSYRIVLADKGPARLQAWAIVDNVSGEDWNQTKVGVGSTSALSFRYDLHSVRLVERETLSEDQPTALAPPTGGSPYAVATRKIRVVGNLTADDLAEFGAQQAALQAPVMNAQVAAGSSNVELPPAPPEQAAQARFRSGGSGGSRANAPSSRESSGKEGKRRDVGRFAQSISQQVKSSNERIRIEGFAQQGDGDPRQASLARANMLRDQLIQQGVPESQIEAIGTGELNTREAVRVVAAGQEGEQRGEQAKTSSAEKAASEDQPLGSAHFVSSVPMTIEHDHSALISILNDETEAERVFYYDPISARGSTSFAFNAVRLKNPSGYTLDSGPFTVYAQSQFLGEGLSEPILPHSIAFIPYALDRSIVADPAVTTREEIDKLLTIQRGIVTTETQRIRKTKVTLSNRGQEAAKVYVRHQVQPGYELRKSALQVEKLNGAYLFPVTVAAGQAVEVVVEETTPIMKTVDIRTPQGIGSIELFLKKGNIEPGLKQKLDDIVKTYQQLGDLEEHIATLDEQLAVYRTRVDELNVQLVTLKQVNQAQKLSKNLADKMQEISEKLQQTTIQLTDLKGQQMTLRVELQDKLADLTLKPKKAGAEGYEDEPKPSTAPGKVPTKPVKAPVGPAKAPAGPAKPPAAPAKPPAAPGKAPAGKR